MVKKISISDQAYELLNRLREELGTSTHSETILVLAERARLCTQLEPRLRKIELLLVRLLEELTGRTSGEGPESPAAGGGKGEHGMSGPVKSGHAADPVKLRGGAGTPSQDI